MKTFGPLTLPGAVNEYRDSSGAPGPKYWQNRADYELHATIDTVAHVLHGVEAITYTNNSPDTLASLWLNLEQNIYRKDSRAGAFAAAGRRTGRSVNSTDGYVLDSVELQGASPKDMQKSPRYVITDTRMQLPLETPLEHGAKLRILIRYHYTIPGPWGGRTSWAATEHGGETYDMAQWYPRMCVYDDIRGWDTQPYLGNEFYLEYGHFDYYVTVPGNFLVAGSGELLNPAAVLTKPELARLLEAKKSDKTILIRTAEEAAGAIAAKPAATKTWHFAMSDTRDVAFSASSAFLWDAARMKIAAGAGKSEHYGLAQSVYPLEATTGADNWSRSTEFLKDSVENFSRRWYPYPYPNAINVAGPTEGMEYPGIIFDGPEERGVVLFFIAAHEIGHTWFPMIVGSNERRDAWIDEGFNTFIDTFESDDFANGVYGPKRDGEYAPDPKLSPADQIVKVLNDADAPPILMRADAIKEKYRHPVTYFKSAFGLTLLRENILGPERFDHAFRKFIADWAFKHPSPSDFFREMESEGGEDLSYFWRGWYLNNWTMDMAIDSAEYLDQYERTKGITVTVSNHGQLVLPSTLRVELTDKRFIDIAIPAETWMQNTTHTFTIMTEAKARHVVLDPDHKLPDSNRANDSLDLIER